MKYQKQINLFDDTSNQPSKFRTKNWVKTNDKSKGEYKKNKIRFKTFMVRSNS